MRHSRTALGLGCVVGLCLLAAAAHGQSINIRFGSAPTTPPPSYAAAGLAGVWNSFLVTPDYGIVPLVSLAGTSIPAQFYQYGSSSILTSNNPLTSGDDKRLMDSMILSTNNPTDGCFWVQNLMTGPYEVTIYAMTPNDPSRLNRTRVDNGSPGPVMVGGTWPGHHQSGITYSRFTVTTTDGVIAFHDGLYGGVLQSGMNAVQFRFLGTCPAPSISAQPSSSSACRSGSAAFSITASSSTALAYRWQFEAAPLGSNSWSDLADGTIPGTTATASNTGTRIATIANTHAAPPMRVRCRAGNACGSTNSNPATFSVCIADTDDGSGTGHCDGGVTIDDLLYYLGQFAQGAVAADVDNGSGTGVQDGGVTIDDLLYYLGRFAAGC